MTKRRDVARLLEENGFVSKGETNHEKFEHADGRYAVDVRHREIDDVVFKIIKKQAGLQ